MIGPGCNRPMRRQRGWLVAVVLAVQLAACSNRPQVICELMNPQTGEHVQMFKEIWFKVPANYDETQHIASWKAAQAAKGFTVQVGP
jgi:hypothetical protein